MIWRMLKLEFSNQAESFVSKLQAKQKRQVSQKLMSLLENPKPQDTKKMKGSDIHYRVDVGEYRIIYTIEIPLIYIFIVGKRNDDDVYRRFKRLIK